MIYRKLRLLLQKKEDRIFKITDIMERIIASDLKIFI